MWGSPAGAAAHVAAVDTSVVPPRPQPAAAAAGDSGGRTPPAPTSRPAPWLDNGLSRDPWHDLFEDPLGNPPPRPAQAALSTADFEGAPGALAA